MTLLLILVFSGIFIVLVLLLIASGANVSKETKQTMSNLESILVSRSRGIPRYRCESAQRRVAERNPLDQSVVAEGRTRALSARMLYQADLKWTAGVLILMSRFFFLVSSYLVYLRTGSLVYFVADRIAAGFCAICFCDAQTKPPVR